MKSYALKLNTLDSNHSQFNDGTGDMNIKLVDIALRERRKLIKTLMQYRNIKICMYSKSKAH